MTALMILQVQEDEMNRNLRPRGEVRRRQRRFQRHTRIRKAFA